ncbi:MAG: AmmeMemoRadiSam system protein B [Thermoanaerobaculia bacterium]
MASNRPPAVAGAFYPSSPEALEAQVRGFLGTGREKEPAFGAIVPHAGYVYSGDVAGQVYSRIDLGRRLVVLCPNHTGLGAFAAVDPRTTWETPLGRVAVDRDLARRFLDRCPSLREDAVAHDREHSLEVQLPFLQICRPEASIVAISLGAPSLSLCREIGEAFADLAAELDPSGGSMQLLASSDMNHYESREVGNRKNALALARIEALDPQGLFDTVVSEDISMCGFLPVTALLYGAARRGGLSAEIVALSDSGAQTRDPSSVVGYAGVVIRGGRNARVG